MESEKKPTPISFRPKERELEQIRLIQERKGCSQAGAIRFALDAACEALEPKGEPQPDADWKAPSISTRRNSTNRSLAALWSYRRRLRTAYRPRRCHGAAVAESKALESEEAKETRKRSTFGGPPESRTEGLCVDNLVFPAMRSFCAHASVPGQALAR